MDERMKEDIVKVRIQGIDIETQVSAISRIIAELSSQPKNGEFVGNKIKPFQNRSATINDDVDKTTDLMDKLPTVKQIADYIIQKPEFRHTSTEIAKFFLGRSIDSAKERRLYNLIWRRAKKARKRLLKEYPKQNWESVRDSREAITYRFIPTVTLQEGMGESERNIMVHSRR